MLLNLSNRAKLAKLREAPRNSAKLREDPRDYAQLRETPRNPAKLRETPRNPVKSSDRISGFIPHTRYKSRNAVNSAPQSRCRGWYP